MFGRDPQGDFFPKLVDSWTVSDDQLTWTFKLEKGVPFHGGWGEMTADDVIWSINEFAAEGSQSGTASDIKRLWQCPDCHVKALDDYTIEVNTGKPGFDMLNRIHAPNAGGTWVISKKQVDELGADEANIQAAGTGPWEMTENSTDDFWKFRAVVDHWRKTPEFGELTFFSIPEEATRVASFQTGNIDTFGAAPDSVPALAQVPGTKFMSQAGSSQSSLLIYGMWHEGVGTPDEAPGYDPDAPYISSNPDTSSPEWEQARKVRLAMGLAIDREKIIKELLRGEGKPLSMFGWATHESREDPDWKWEYDPERARQLLKEAGYEDGFEVGLTPAIRNAPGEVEACEAVGAMWQDVGITARIQSIPFGTLVQGQLTRTNTGIVCHASQPFTEPLVIYSSLYDPTGNWSSGTDHPFLTPLLSKANETFDTEERWALQKEMASFIWDNTFSIGLYQVNSIYPLGPNLDSWAEHLETGDPRRISSLEFAPHRK
jgi:peptide/nickel transport system substrate-binding protein